MSTPVSVVYIAGSSHSGSTLLDLLLGSHSAIESVGEAKKIPHLQTRIGHGERPLCTCQEELSRCPLWSEVIAQDVGDLMRDPGANASLFRSVAKKRGASVILDSSKTIGRALLFARSDLFTPVFVHLVRDSRAVVYSSKRKARKDRGRTHRLGQTARGWQQLNSRIPRRLGRGKPGAILAIRYEDLTSNPKSELTRVLGRIGLSWEEPMLRFRDHVHHNVEGNRMRLGSGSEIKRDEEYLCGLNSWEWAMVTLLTWRGLRKFGYPLKRSPVEPVGGTTVPSFR